MVDTKALLAEMARNGETIKSLAEKLHITPMTLGKKINNKAKFYLDEAMEICRILNIENPLPIFFAKNIAL